MVPRVLLRCCSSPRPVFLPVPAYLSPSAPGGAFLRRRLNQRVIYLILGGVAFLTHVQ